MRKEVQALSTPRLIFRFVSRMTFFAFALTLAYKLVTRLNPIAMLKALVSDMFASLFDALRIVFLWPFRLVGAVPGWLFREFLTFFKDIRTALGFIPVFTSIALRLTGAYVLFWYVGPVVLLVCVVWPLEFIFGERGKEEQEQAQKERGGSTADSAIAAAMLILLNERRRSETEATQRRTARVGRGGRNRPGH